TVPSFVSAPQYPAGPAPYAVAVGDFNGDGHADLVAANNTFPAGGTLSVLFNNGDGTYQAPPRIRAGGQTPYSVAVGGVGGDQVPALVAANSAGGTGGVLRNEGDGSFAAAGNYAVGITPASVAMGDLDGDSDFDLAVANYNSATVSVLTNQGNGTFAAAVNYAV